MDAQIAGGDRPIKIASLDGKTAHFAGIKAQQARFEIVPPVEHPDLTWDPASHDVLAWGDVVAYGVDPSDLPSVIDRAMAVRELKLIASKTPQPIKVTPDDSLHRNASLVRIEVPDVAGRALILFDITGDGTVAGAVSDWLGSLYASNCCVQLSSACPRAVRQRPTCRRDIPAAHDGT